MPNLDRLTPTQITARLDSEIPSTYDLSQQFNANEYQKASVLIPFVRENDAWHILFIRRADSDRDRHSGQVSFVGGKAEDSDSNEIDTALRETNEEIGVATDDVKVLGELGSHFSVSRFQITPIVATLPWPYNLTLQASEVSRTFTIPLCWLANDNNFEIRDRQPPESDTPVPVVFYNEFNGELLWGATAKMIVSLIQVLKNK